MQKQYLLTHYRGDGSKTKYAGLEYHVLDNDDFAINFALGQARIMKADGLTGKLVCTGHWGAEGFELEIPLDDIESVADPLAEMAEDVELPGYGKLIKVAESLWPCSGGSIVPSTIKFTVFDDCIKVSFSQPRNVLVEMVRGDKKIEVYHGGPSLRLMMVRLNLTEAQARGVWDEIVKELCLLAQQK